MALVAIARHGKYTGERGDDGDSHRGEKQGRRGDGRPESELVRLAMPGGGRELGDGLKMGKGMSRGVRELYRGDRRGNRAELRRERRWASCKVRRRRDEIGSSYCVARLALGMERRLRRDKGSASTCG
jgi:hypothetical protein